jgi:phosphoribosylformylglycinamidine synthase subunit PurL
LQTHLVNNWQEIGQVNAIGGSLEISTADNLMLISARIEVMGDRWLNAIERRLSAEL